MNHIGMTGLVIVASLACCTAAAAQEPVFDEDGPFRRGEDIGPPASCDTMADWIDRAPDYDGRISMAIDGVITESHWDGALAYVIMCDPDQVQVMCVTYYPQEVTGDVVRFAGGYNRHAERQVVLDPCLVFPADSSSDLR